MGNTLPDSFIFSVSGTNELYIASINEEGKYKIIHMEDVGKSEPQTGFWKPEEVADVINSGGWEMKEILFEDDADVSSNGFSELL